LLDKAVVEGEVVVEEEEVEEDIIIKVVMNAKVTLAALKVVKNIIKLSLLPQQAYSDYL
jgi:uncharacterized protein YuzE